MKLKSTNPKSKILFQVKKPLSQGESFGDTFLVINRTYAKSL